MIYKEYIFLALVVLKLSLVGSVYAQSDKQSYDQECLLAELKRSTDDATVGVLRKRCVQPDPDQEAQAEDLPLGAISKRILQERITEFNPYVITPHRMNYILPYMQTDNINRSVYSGVEQYASRLEDTEVKFQLSFKIPLSGNDVFIDHDGFYFGMTIKSFWQIYADDISSPFRETNYLPEFFYLMPLNLRLGRGNTGFAIGVEHESNGRSMPLSRSWNRIFLNFLYEKDNFALSFRTWQRIEEDPKETVLDPGGDDNPDIKDYMGRFELLTAYQWKHYEVHWKLRKNFDTGYGAHELGFTFPLWGRVRAYFQYFNGYGESLIDYNHKQERFGIGVAITDLL